MAIIVEGRIALDTSLDQLATEGRTLEDAFVAAAGDDAGGEEAELSWL